MPEPDASTVSGPAARETALLRFGERVRTLREAAGLRQEDVATLAGIDRVTISQIEHGKREVGVTRVGPLAAALGVQPGVLFEAAETRAP